MQITCEAQSAQNDYLNARKQAEHARQVWQENPTDANDATLETALNIAANLYRIWAELSGQDDDPDESETNEC